ncbi:MAG: glutaryl-7-ACA acylase, partial [Phenylobacterium sp.]|uniref:CocE/NonD family hydrolase n=1 Tax=Phenylobacterium sp. TaxID=1871053 RepID=UPI0011FCAD76
MRFQVLLAGAAACAALALSSAVAQPATPYMTPDIAKDFEWPKASYDYEKRVEMIPMRDGVKLYTVMIIPKGARDAPILLTRTPYNAKRAAQRALSPHAAATGQ